MNNLFIAQKEAHNSLSSHLFPRYIENGTLGIRLCNVIHDSLDCIHKAALKVQQTVSYLFLTSYSYVEKTLAPITKTFYPINPVNGEHYLALIPRVVEKRLGDYVLFPLNTLGNSMTREKLPYSNQKMSAVIDEVVDSLNLHNQNILNPPNEVPFEYKMQTATNPDINAYALPGGKMVIFSQLLKELAEAIESKDIKETTVHFEDGSIAHVDLSGVTLKDALAAVIGHEMTHIASRHHMGRLIFTSMLKTICHVVGDINNMIYRLSESCYSRKQEIEADVTGAFFASQAGFNPLGALYIQEFFRSNTSPQVREFFKWLEPLSSHPYGEKRSRALLTALSTLAPELLDGKVTWIDPKESSYDLTNASPAVLTAGTLQARTSESFSSRENLERFSV